MINLTLVSASPSNFIAENGEYVYITYSLNSTQPIFSLGIAYGDVITTSIEDVSDYEKIIQVQTSAAGSIILSASNIVSETTSIETSGIAFINGDNVNLLDYIPSHLRMWKNGQPSEFEQLIKFFQDFLNTMYVQRDGTYLTILEKIKKLTEMHDADEIDYEYINFFANYLGYDIGITKTIIATISGEEEESENVQRQVRQIVRELPNWYRIKSTRDAIKIMLYSFGIVSDLQQYYSSNYSTFKLNTSTSAGSFSSDVTNDLWPTPHFSLNINLFESIPEWVTQIENIIKLIDDVKPINVVLDRITASLLARASESSTALATAMAKVVTYSRIPLTAQIN